MCELARSLRITGSLILAGSFASAGLLGCSSPYVQTVVLNSGKVELHNIEVDYPSASFGISSLAPGAEYHYRFKIQDAGRMKVQFSDNAEHSHNAKGPYISQGQQGTMEIVLDGSGAAKWRTHLHPNMPDHGEDK
jgi:hypothetical protein